ncbi:MAG: hypothetical protein R3F02_12745 [Thiolinea sp.]
MPAPLSVHSKPIPFQNSEKNLQLLVILPDGLNVSDSQIFWQVKGAGQKSRKLRGNHHSLDLDDGLYKIQLRIGRYKAEKRVLVQKQQQLQPYFRANIGHLQVQADHPVQWQVDGPDNIRFETSARYAIDEIVPAGEYRVKTVLPGVVQLRNISVKSGEQQVQRLSVPMGTVNLMVIRDNQPLLQAMEWEVFRLNKGKRHSIGKYYLHANSIRIPPGKYEAVVNHRNKTGKRRFWVQESTTNKVILEMD